MTIRLAIFHAVIYRAEFTFMDMIEAMPHLHSVSLIAYLTLWIPFHKQVF